MFFLKSSGRSIAVVNSELLFIDRIESENPPCRRLADWRCWGVGEGLKQNKCPSGAAKLFQRQCVSYAKDGGSMASLMRK